MLVKHYVDTLHLNFRNTPSSQNRKNIIAVLPIKQEVFIEEENLESPGKWIAIQTTIAKRKLHGFVAFEYLSADPQISEAVLWNQVGPVHMPENRVHISRNPHKGRAYPIGEPNRPQRDLSTQESSVQSLHQIIDWLNVENSHRYKPGNHTYCNIYAYDFCYLAGVYLPRVWWTDAALCRLWNQKPTAATYAKTIMEKNANSIFDWFKEFSEQFGWQRVFFEEEIQNEVNQGKIGIIVAKRKKSNFSGHITVVAPETETLKAFREEGKIIIPLQSQAGRNNRKYFTGLNANDAWHRHARYQEFGFWVHD